MSLKASESILNTIGNNPLVKLQGLSKELNWSIYAKLFKKNTCEIHFKD
jgi:cysteine synthase